MMCSPDGSISSTEPFSAQVFEDLDVPKPGLAVVLGRPLRQFSEFVDACRVRLVDDEVDRRVVGGREGSGELLKSVGQESLIDVR
jgi:hypothetical protein